MKHQIYPNKLADVIDVTQLEGQQESINKVNSELSEEGFRALRKLLLLLLQNNDAVASFNKGYDLGYQQGYDNAHYHNYND